MDPERQPPDRPLGAVLPQPLDPLPLPEGAAAAAALRAWELGLSPARRFAVRERCALLPHPLAPLRPEDGLEAGDELVLFYDLAVALREGRPVAGFSGVPPLGNLPALFAPLPSPRAKDRPVLLPLPPLGELWELLDLPPCAVALSAWPGEGRGVLHDPSGREALPPEAALLLRRAGLCAELGGRAYPPTALLLDAEGRLWRGSFAAAMERVETHPMAPRFRGYLRHGAVLPLDDPPLEEDDPSDALGLDPQGIPPAEPGALLEPEPLPSAVAAARRRALRRALARLGGARPAQGEA